MRLLADGQLVDLSTPDAGDPDDLGIDVTQVAHPLVVVDRLTAGQEERDRLADSLATCFAEGEGEAVVLMHDPSDGGVMGRLVFTEHFRCANHPEIEFSDPTPKLFSFNNPYGSCPTCTGFGATLDYDVDLIVPNLQRSIDEGAVDPWTKPRYHKEREQLRSYTLSRGVSLYSPWKELPEDFREEVLYGAEDFKGVIPFLISRERKRYKQYIRVFPPPVPEPTDVPLVPGRPHPAQGAPHQDCRALHRRREPAPHGGPPGVGPRPGAHRHGNPDR